MKFHHKIIYKTIKILSSVIPDSENQFQYDSNFKFIK